MARVSDVIRERLGECSPAERKVARALLAAYPSAGLETVARLADRAGVSAPTVLRFVGRLGFGGFPEFHDTLRAELNERDASPIALYERTEYGSRPPTGAATLLRQAGLILQQSVAQTFATVPPDDFQAAIDLLADPGRRVLVLGGRFTRLIGRYLALHLVQMRDDVHPLSELSVERAATLARLGRKDVVVVFDYRRYEPDTLTVARHARDQGARVILFTDPWLSPIASLADVVLPCEVGAPSPYDSLVPTFATVEALVAGILTALGPAAHDHMLHVEDTARLTNLYSQDSGDGTVLSADPEPERHPTDPSPTPHPE
ncbi:MurR/RpiR family transcriptional regulator [Streptosporangium oxazolinicum]|uniref:MurR/RpiR family transcriptional regulator n=1 Tax=Streptosporangium oxazolinicum TaxID=909287 RepID=A0ABP8BNB4_9ACTN